MPRSSTGLIKHFVAATALGTSVIVAGMGLSHAAEQVNKPVAVPTFSDEQIQGRFHDIMRDNRTPYEN